MVHLMPVILSARDLYHFLHLCRWGGKVCWVSCLPDCGIQNHIILSCTSFMSGATRYGRKVIRGTNDLVALSDGQNQSASFNTSSGYMKGYLYQALAGDLSFQTLIIIIFAAL